MCSSMPGKCDNASRFPAWANSQAYFHIGSQVALQDRRC
jgi:hypothetical protein